MQTVSHAKAAIGWNMHRLGVCDVATLQREYDVPDYGTRISTCLDLATTLTLTASQTRIGSGASSTLTATLRIGSSSAYDLLKNNPLTGRTVSLQRRLVGTTTWVAAGTISPGSASGTYAITVKPLSSTEYRATFKAPTTEGLDGSTSAGVTVTVVGCGTTCATAAS